MSMSDTLGDMLTRIRNGLQTNKTIVEAPSSKFRANVLEVLKREGYIRGFSSVEHKPGIKHLKIELKYQEGVPVISEIKRVSKPGCRVYSGINELPKVFKSKTILFAQGASQKFKAPSGGDIYYKNSEFFKEFFLNS